MELRWTCPELANLFTQWMNEPSPSDAPESEVRFVPTVSTEADNTHSHVIDSPDTTSVTRLW